MGKENLTLDVADLESTPAFYLVARVSDIQVEFDLLVDKTVKYGANSNQILQVPPDVVIKKYFC